MFHARTADGDKKGGLSVWKVYKLVRHVLVSSSLSGRSSSSCEIGRNGSARDSEGEHEKGGGCEETACKRRATHAVSNNFCIIFLPPRHIPTTKRRCTSIYARFRIVATLDPAIALSLSLFACIHAVHFMQHEFGKK